MDHDPYTDQTDGPNDDGGDRASASAIFLYLATFLAWMTEGAALVIHVSAKRKLDPLGHSALIVVWALLTLFACFRGKKGFVELARAAGRGHLTGIQAVLVVCFMILFGGVAAFIGIRLSEN